MAPAPPPRLQSIDALRGFDMFWIIGGGWLVQSTANQTRWQWADTLAAQMHHAPWGSFAFLDLIFPLFMFLSGVTIPYALLSKRDRGVSTLRLNLKVLRRAVILVALGVVYNGGLQLKPLAETRVASVLGQIGLAYLIAAMIALHLRSLRAVLIATAGILAGYAALQLAVPVPGHGAGVFTGPGSINGYIDRLLLPGKLLGKSMDPEGLLCIVSASSVTLMGVAAGLTLRSGASSPYRKAALFLGIGAGMVVAALLLKTVYPLIKSLWTVPYNLLAGGLSLVLLAVFYTVIDIWGLRRWSFMFQVLGLNSITVYMAHKMVAFPATAQFLLGGVAAHSGAAGPVILAAGVIALQWLVLYLLYRQKIFLRV